MARVCRVWELAHLTIYAHRRRVFEAPQPPCRREPHTPISDDLLLTAIREAPAASPWVREGNRKVWARLRLSGLRASRRGVLRVMRAATLLAPTRTGSVHGPKAHDGTITTTRPDEIWGIDRTSTVTRLKGNASIFILVDHCTTESLGIHVTHRATHFELIESLRRAV